MAGASLEALWGARCGDKPSICGLHTTFKCYTASMPGDRDYRAGGKPNDWDAFINALQVLVLVGGAAVTRLRDHDQQDACREVVAAAARVLELTPQVLPPQPGLAMNVTISTEERPTDGADPLQAEPHVQLR